MAYEEARRRADQKYKREKTRLVGVRFYPADADLLAHVLAQPNKQGYIKDLIRADMEKQASSCEN